MITITLPFSYIIGMSEIQVYGIPASGWTEDQTQTAGALSNVISVNTVPGQQIQVVQFNFVYYSRASSTSNWVPSTDVLARIPYSMETLNNVPIGQQLYKRLRGRSGLNFMWLHAATDYNLIDPSPTNINDLFIIQKGYYNDLRSWLQGTGPQPTKPTPLQLRNDYQGLLQNAMISDTVVLQHGNITLLFGSKAAAELQAQLLVVKRTYSSLTNSQIQLKVVNLVNSFFDINNWDFGETFYFQELATYIQYNMAADISSVVLVPTAPNHFFGDMYQVTISQDSIVQPDISIEDVQVVTSLNSINLKQYAT